MSISFNRDRCIFYFRMWALPMLLIFVFLLQLSFPVIHKHGALWSERMQWWQFLTCNFLSRDISHLAFNVGGLVVVYSQFAPQVRGPILALVFCFFATISNLIFFEWLMPRHAWLIGASGGSYALLGFFSWFLRKAYFGVGIRKRNWLKFKIIPVLVTTIVIEYLYARWRMPTLAWQMHAIGFGLGVGIAAVIHAAYAASRLAAFHWSGQGALGKVSASIHEGIYRIKQFSEISGKSGIAEKAV